MDETGTILGRGAFRRVRRGSRPDYKRKLAQTALLRPHAASDETTTAEASFLLAGQIEKLAGRDEVGRASFQSVAVTVLQTLDRVRYHEDRAAEAALSLAQRQKLHHMVAEVDAVSRVLGRMLNPHGATMLDRQIPAPAGEAPEPSWWYALCEALYALEAGTATVQSVTLGQPRNSVVHTLGCGAETLLQQHYGALFTEAEQWMS